MPVPEFALRALFGEMAEQTLLASQRVVRSRLTDHGFSFAFPQVEEALAMAVKE
jgi:NAD dependent epimerase/dehydratase family enzyme